MRHLASKSSYPLFVTFQIPTLILYGENDQLPFCRPGVALLENIPISQTYKMADAGHPCYLDKPDEWHTILYNFLNIVEAQS